jgi:hypothetical protein
MTPQEHKWVETNNSLCAVLRQVHDVLALSSLPPKRKWVGLTDEDKQTAVWTNGTFGGGALWAEAMLKEKNT